MKFTVLPAMSCLVIAISAIPWPCRAARIASLEPHGVSIAATEDSGDVFRRVLTQIANQNHIAIIAEGEPPSSTISEKDAAAFAELSDTDAPMFQRFLEAFDYKAERVSSVLVLKKRYTRPDEFPSVTFGQCADSLRAIVRITDPYNPHLTQKLVSRQNTDGRDLAFGDLVASFSQEQLRAMRAAPIPFRQLTLDQQVLAKDGINFNRVEDAADQAIFGSDCLAKASRGDVSFLFGETKTSKHTLGVRLPVGVKNKPMFAALYDPGTYSVLSGGSMNVTDLLQPATEAELPIAAPDAKLQRATTLKDLMRQITTDAHAREYTLDAAIETLPVTFAGQGYAKPSDIFPALASLYGLQISRVSPDSGKSQSVLGIPEAPPPPSDETQLSRAVVAALPENVVRWLHIHERSELVERERVLTNIGAAEYTVPLGEHPAEETPEELRQAMQERQESNVGRHTIEQTNDETVKAGDAPHKLRKAMARRLRELLEPVIAKSATGEIAFTDTDGTVRDAFATMILTNDLDNQIVGLPNPDVDYLGHWDRIYVQCKPVVADSGSGKGRVLLSFQKKDAYGRISAFMGTSIPYVH